MAAASGIWKGEAGNDVEERNKDGRYKKERDGGRKGRKWQ